MKTLSKSELQSIYGGGFLKKLKQIINPDEKDPRPETPTFGEEQVVNTVESIVKLIKSIRKRRK